MGRFSHIAVKIWDLKPKVALHAMIATLKLEAFTNSLGKNRPTSMLELRRRATGFIQMEELFEFCDKASL